MINWQQAPEPTYNVSISPPLLSYVFALVIAIAGENVPLLHVAMIPWILVARSEEHTSELQSQSNLVCRLLLEKKNKQNVRRISEERSHIERAQPSIISRKCVGAPRRE